MVEKIATKRKLPIKKRYIILLIILGWVFLKDPLICASGMGEFRFECYSTAEEIQEALYKLHPKGSDLKKFKITMNEAGALFLGSGIEKDYYYEGYDYKQGFMNWYGWSTDIFSNSEKKSIKEIKSYERNQGISEL